MFVQARCALAQTLPRERCRWSSRPVARVAPDCSLNGLADRHVTIERWTRVDGTRTANVVNGKVVVHAPSAAALPPQPRGASSRNAEPRSDYPYLLSLPTDPNAPTPGP
jgi:hypothetical protein